MIVTIDNFFQNPDEWRKWALSLEYKDNEHFGIGENQSLWVGKRTKAIRDKDLAEYIKNQFKLQDWPDIFCHYTRLSDHFTEFWPHKDNKHTQKAGVIYLHPKPPAYAGTLVNGHYIENKYNRGVCYNSDYLHSLVRGFGETKEDARLTITFFEVKDHIRNQGKRCI